MKRFYHQQVANRQTRGCREISGQGRREWVGASRRQEGAGCSPFPTAPEEFWAGDPVPPSLLHTPLGCDHAKCCFLLLPQKSKTPRVVGTGAWWSCLGGPCLESLELSSSRDLPESSWPQAQQASLLSYPCAPCPRCPPSLPLHGTTSPRTAARVSPPTTACPLLHSRASGTTGSQFPVRKGGCGPEKRQRRGRGGQVLQKVEPRVLLYAADPTGLQTPNLILLEVLVHDLKAKLGLTDEEGQGVPSPYHVPGAVLGP